MTRALRAIASDLDGTLLRSDLSISARTRAALSAVEARGLLLVFVTGRPPRWIRPVAEQVDHKGLVICANGALLYDLHTEQVVAGHLIEPAVLVEVIGRLRAADPELAFAIEYGAEFVHEPAYPVPVAHRRADVRTVAPAELLEHAAAKLLIRHARRESGDLLAQVRGSVAELVEVTHSTPSGPGLLEISAAGVSKASGLARLCAEHGIGPEAVAAFGDMPNDLPMLEWVGRPYAMANAHPEVLSRVVGRAPSNDEDGVAAVVEELLGIAADPLPGA